MRSCSDKKMFYQVSLLRDLRHPCVVLLIGISTADSLPIMVLEYMAGRDLYTLIHNSNRYRRISSLSKANGTEPDLLFWVYYHDLD